MTEPRFAPLEISSSADQDEELECLMNNDVDAYPHDEDGADEMEGEQQQQQQQQQGTTLSLPRKRFSQDDSTSEMPLSWWSTTLILILVVGVIVVLGRPPESIHTVSDHGSLSTDTSGFVKFPSAAPVSTMVDATNRSPMTQRSDPPPITETSSNTIIRSGSPTKVPDTVQPTESPSNTIIRSEPTVQPAEMSDMDHPVDSTNSHEETEEVVEVAAPSTSTPTTTPTTTTPTTIMPTTTVPASTPTTSPPTAPSSFTEPWTAQHLPDDPIHPEHYFVYPIYQGQWNYRRVCAPIGDHVHLCLTIRYPFEIPQQDPSVPYPKPVPEFFNDPDFSLPLHIIDGTELEYCRTTFVEGVTTTATSMSWAIQQCIDYYHDQSVRAEKRTSTACWSYERSGKFYLYGVQASDRQKLRTQEYFNRQIIYILGMSPTPPIASNWQRLFTNCRREMVGVNGESLCIPNGEPHITSWEQLYDPKTNWTMIRLTSVLAPGHDENHPLLPNLEKNLPWTPSHRLKVTPVSEHPIAHLQDHNRLTNEYEATVGETDHYIRSFLADCHNQTQLDAWNIDISTVISFDGSPQFNPTVSGAYPFGRHNAPNSMDEFIANHGYPGWIPDYGAKCRGFLTSNSILTKFNDFGRSMYQQYGQDMNWYGQTWEFINLVWYSMNNWHGKGGQLDCTHGDSSQVSIMHMYFLMAMVDNHYDSLAERREASK